ncbi:MAG TPA: hypothetical protein VGM44_06260 [Polyangiaceae bacterium]|jgi:hypothetical protein
MNAATSARFSRALVGFLLVFLQLASALHFTLVRHTFSAALGGVVHVHGETRREPAQRVSIQRSHARELTNASASCLIDICPYADAAHGSLPETASRLSGVAHFGEPRLLGAAEAESPRSRRMLQSAPKTSPPV